MSSLVAGLGANGTFVVVGAAPDPIEVSSTLLILGKRTIKEWSAGTPSDSEDTLCFAEMAGIRPMIGKYPLEKAARSECLPRRRRAGCWFQNWTHNTWGIPSL